MSFRRTECGCIQMPNSNDVASNGDALGADTVPARRGYPHVGWKHRVAVAGATTTIPRISIEAKPALVATMGIAASILTMRNSLTISIGQKS